MLIDKTISYLFTGTRYLVWGMALIGIIGSVILFWVNLPLGLLSATTFVASLALAISLSLLLAPRLLTPWLSITNRLTIGLPAFLIALAVMGMIYYAHGGFPTLNLLF